MVEGHEFRVSILTAEDHSRPRILGGNATLRIDGGVLTLHARAAIPFLLSPPFSQQTTREIPVAEIVDVDCDRDIVSFDRRFVRQDGAGFHEYVFRAASHEEASKIASLLPPTTTPGFAERRQEDKAFASALGAAAPSAYVTWTIIAINAVVYVLMGISGVGWFSPDPAKMLAWGANSASLTLDGQWWRLLTAAFLHFGILHIALNMWALYAAGDLTERLFGNRFYFLIYFFGAIASSMASTWWSPGAIEAGASGAVFAVYGALLAYLLFQRKSFPTGVVQPMLKNVLVFVGGNVAFGLSSQGISNSAHLGGLFSGLVMGALVCRPLHSEHRSRQALPRAMAGVLFGVAVIAGGVHYLAKQADTITGIGPLRTEIELADGQTNQVLASWKTLATQAEQGMIVPSELLDRLEHETVPQLKAIGDQLAAKRPANLVRVEAIQACEMRIQAFAALDQAIRTGNHRALLQYEALLADADAKMTEVRKSLKMATTQPQ